MSRPNSRIASAGRLWLLGLVAVSAIGCGNDGSVAGSVGAGTEAARATYEDHEHHVPEHKPVSFPDAVESLRRRTKELRRLLSASRRETSVSARSAEVREIVGWLPLLGADGDLTEAEWEPIRRAAADLERLYPRAVAGPAGPARDEAFAEIGRVLESLAEIAAARPDAFEVTPHPDHHHHPHGRD